MNVNELIEANVSFSIVEEDTPLDKFVEIVKVDTEFGSGPGVDTPYWTTTGDDPVIHDQAYQADLVRSAGGWSDVEPEFEDARDWTWSPMSEWSEYHLYLARKKEERETRYLKIIDWIRRQSNAQKLIAQFTRFRCVNQRSYQHCAKYHCWDSLLLTRKQWETIEWWYHYQLRKLP